MKYLLFTLLFVLNSSFFLLKASTFLIQEWILEEKKIDIPDYPHAFNPSIVPWKEGYLLSFRIVPDPKKKFDCLVGLVKLDENFNIAGSPQILNTTDPDSSIPSRIDDARLLLINDRLWMVYADNKDKTITKGGFRVYIGELEEDNEKFTLIRHECLSRFEDESIDKREKNWTPFDYKGAMLLSYSLNPHRVLYPEIGTGECKTIAETNASIQWHWGHLRGGTPALIDGDHYLAFFHSTVDMASPFSQEKSTAHYFIGAYLFTKDYPFQITHISPSPLIGKTFYKGDTYKPYWKPVTVVFPCGFVHNDQFVWIAYGQHDHETWIAKIDKKQLMKSLIPCTAG